MRIYVEVTKKMETWSRSRRGRSGKIQGACEDASGGRFKVKRVYVN
jgi:hypothetical protein